MVDFAEMTPLGVAGQAEFLRAGGYTRRYHGWRTLKDDPVGLHSYNVANLVLLLRPDCRKELVVAAIRHDSPEWVVGDPPSTAKRRVPGLKEAMDDYEREVLAAAGIPDACATLTPEEYAVLKLADYLDGMAFCVQELQMGNRLIIPVFNVFEGYMRERLADQPFGPEHELYNHYVMEWHNLGGTR